MMPVGASTHLHYHHYFFFFLMIPRPPESSLFPYTTLFRSFQTTIQVHTPVPMAPITLLTDWLPAGEKRSEEHTSELPSLAYLLCRLLLEKKKLGRREPNPRRVRT